MENNNTEIYKRLAVESFADYLGKYLSYGIINAIDCHNIDVYDPVCG